MKRLMFVFLIYTIMIFMLPSFSYSQEKTGSCNSIALETSAPGIVYNNPALGFSLVLPASWNGKYVAKAHKEAEMSYVEFLHKGILSKNKYGGRIFNISIFKTHQGNLLDMGGKYIGTKNGKYYYFFTPTDVQYENASSQQLKEYKQMEKSTTKINKSVILK